MDREIYKLDQTPLGDKCIAELYPHTGNEYKYKNWKMPEDDWTDGYIILPLKVFETVACGRMCCAQIQSAQMIAKKRSGRPDKGTDRRTDGHILSTGSH